MSELFRTAIVEKRNILNELRCNHMTLQELRFFSIYLSKINPWDTATRVVRFPLDDFRKIMGLGTDVNITHFKHTIRHLLQQIVEVPNEDDAGYTAFQLFKRAKLQKGKEEEWYVEFDAHDDALPLMFEFKNRYFQYELWNALGLKSPNQIRMYEILKQYEGLGKRELSVVELRELLGISAKEYDRWQNFKVRVLDSCQEALREKTDICYTYERGRVGRGGKWLTIVFHIRKNKNYVSPLTLEAFLAQELAPATLALTETEAEEVDETEQMIVVYGSEHMAELAEVCQYEFDKDQMRVIFGLLQNLPIPPDRITNDLHYGRVFWLKNQYHKFLVAAHQAELYGEPIQNRYRYFYRMLENADF